MTHRDSAQRQADEDTADGAARPEPRVQIGMPTRGGGPYIDEALGSIIGQTFEAWRLVISENGPGSAEFAEFLKPYLRDSRIRHEVTGRDLGMAANHTRLIRSGEAPYVALLHDDDVWEPDFLRRRVEFLDAHRDAAFVFGQMKTVDERGERVRSHRVDLQTGVHPPRVTLPLFVRFNPVGMPTILVRRSAYVAVGAEFASDIPMIDYEMWCRIAARFPIGFIDVDDAAWRWHRDQTSQRVGRWGEGWLRFYSYLEETLAATPDVDVDVSFLRRQRAAAAFCAALDALEVNDRDRARLYVHEGVRARPLSRLDPRALLIASALPIGGPAIRFVLTLRHGVRWGRGRLGPVRAKLREGIRATAGRRRQQHALPPTSGR